MKDTSQENQNPIGEKKLIETVFRPLTLDADSSLSLKDDCACVHFDSNKDVVITKDALVAGVHFFPDDAAEDVGWKMLAVNLSDLVAKGAKPHSYLMAISIPSNISLQWLKSFSDGLSALQELSGCYLIGGDTVFTPGPLTLSATAFGVCPKGSFVSREGASPGDLVYVTGTIGDAALGLRIRSKDQVLKSVKLSNFDKNYLMMRYLRPEPRISMAPSLRQFASAAMDISDGLLGDFRTLCNVSGVGGTLKFEDVPLSNATRNAIEQAQKSGIEKELIDIIVGGGDDYEILATVPPGSAGEFENQALNAEVKVKQIGRIESNEDRMVSMFHHGKQVQPEKENYSHF